MSAELGLGCAPLLPQQLPVLEVDLRPFEQPSVRGSLLTLALPVVRGRVELFRQRHCLLVALACTAHPQIDGPL